MAYTMLDNGTIRNRNHVPDSLEGAALSLSESAVRDFGLTKARQYQESVTNSTLMAPALKPDRFLLIWKKI